MGMHKELRRLARFVDDHERFLRAAELAWLEVAPDIADAMPDPATVVEAMLARNRSLTSQLLAHKIWLQDVKDVLGESRDGPIPSYPDGSLPDLVRRRIDAAEDDGRRAAEKTISFPPRDFARDVDEVDIDGPIPPDEEDLF